MVSRFHIFAALITLLTIGCGPVIAHMLDIWLTGSAYHHGLFVLPIVSFLILNRSIGNLHGSPSLKACVTGLMVMIPALFLLWAGASYDIRAFGHIAIVIALIAIFIASFGPAQAMRHRFALGFLVFMVPIGDLIIPPLQMLTTSGIMLGFNISGMEITRDGFLLTTQAGRFDVAEACAGLRFLMAALMAASLFSHLKIKERSIQVKFVALAVGLALLANIVRAYSMVLIATLTDMRMATGTDHYYFGWIIYLGMFICLFGLGNTFAHGKSKNQS